MKVVINLPNDLINKMRDYKSKGGYKDMTSVVVDALNKLFETDDNEKPHDLNSLSDIQIHDNLETDNVIEVSDSSEPSARKYDDLKPDKIRNMADSQFLPKFSDQILSEAIQENVEPIYVGNDSKSLPLLNEDRILWGQENRYFPIKAALRGIYAKLKHTFDEKGYTHISNFNKKGELFKYFAALGLAVNNYDVQAQRRKGEKISTGMPYGREPYKIEKSTIRYMAHYLFEVRKKDNLVDGALAKLKFIKIIKVDGEGFKVGVTQAGYDFAKLPNPFFDGLYPDCGVMDYGNPELNAVESLSYDEKNFIINHLTDYYVAEIDGMKKLLVNISDGIKTPTAVKASMESFLGSELSPSSLGTMVNGLVSRCTELSLINKTKHGLNVTYNVSSEGKSLINQ